LHGAPHAEIFWEVHNHGNHHHQQGCSYETSCLGIFIFVHPSTQGPGVGGRKYFHPPVHPPRPPGLETQKRVDARKKYFCPPVHPLLETQRNFSLTDAIQDEKYVLFKGSVETKKILSPAQNQRYPLRFPT